MAWIKRRKNEPITDDDIDDEDFDEDFDDDYDEEDDEDGGTDYAVQVYENNQHVFFGQVLIGE